MLEAKSVLYLWFLLCHRGPEEKVAAIAVLLRDKCFSVIGPKPSAVF